ncbi:DUF554 domain-containing protein [Geoglobus acetivorans]|uniref:DUF554 domain-containing protein n=1 Tax=Geoglobus acetivorans TaxID=565033 RepID=A0A0A7GEX5_GEOAI|nr:hypothetical protein GACE_0429 [Geoglobus acetivorans]
MIGTLINVASIVFFSIAGIAIGSKIGEELKEYLMKVLGLVVLLIGVEMAFETTNFAILTLTILTGSVMGSVMKIEERLEEIGLKIERKFEGSKFADGFVASTLLFCVGSMAVIGPIQEALTGDSTLLMTKAMLDGIASLALSSALGIGVAFSAIPVLLYQSFFYFTALGVREYATDLLITELTATGGVMIAAIGINLMKLTNMKPGNMLPSLLVLPVYLKIFSILTAVMS